MKNYSRLFSFSLLIITGVVCIASPKVFATVGGPTYVYDFTYNPANESVYYGKIDNSGRGCPPELLKISLATEKVTTDFSCDQGEKLPWDQVPTEIDKITKNFKPLTPLSLKSNHISIDVNFVKEESFPGGESSVLKRHFTAVVYQNGIQVKEFPITGCSTSQPFTFQGYAVPGFNKKIILLLSTKGDCFEGGYILESVYVIGGVDNLDKKVTDNFYKGPSALLPNEDNLVIYEADIVGASKPGTATTSTSTTQTPPGESKIPWYMKLINWLKSLF